MAVFVTNPRSRRSNGALNKMIAAKLGVKIGTEAGRKAVADYKRQAGYKLGGGEGAALEKARKAKKARTAASKAHTKKTGMSLTKAFIQKQIADRAAAKAPAAAPKRGGRRAAAPVVVVEAPTRGRRAAAAPKAGKAGKAPNRIEKMANGKVMYFIDGKPTGRLKYEAAMATKKAPAAKATAGAKAASGKGKGKGKGTAAKKAAAAAKKNPYGFFARRRNGGALDSATGFLRSQLSLRSLAYTGGTAAVVGIAHAYLAPMIGTFVAEQGSKVPVVGQYIEQVGEYAPYTITGLVAGTVVAGVGAALNLSPMLYGSAAVLALTSGIVMDTVSFVGSMSSSASADKAGIVYNGLAYSGIAVTNPGYSGVAITNPGYGSTEDERGMMAEYGDAQESDAYISGDDFDDEEGQAFIDGPRAFFDRFGRPARVASRVRGPYSRHAGKRGHRWAWLVKLIGFQKAAEIASLPADRRMSVLSALKRQAVASLPALMAQQTQASQIAQQGVYSVNMTGAGAEGAGGASGYGALVYAGAGY